MSKKTTTAPATPEPRVRQHKDIAKGPSLGWYVVRGVGSGMMFLRKDGTWSRYVFDDGGPRGANSGYWETEAAAKAALAEAQEDRK